ncbi:MAG: LuxR C-terminal-related transcriptional regulator [Xanthobacteraceae bacterium]
MSLQIVVKFLDRLDRMTSEADINHALREVFKLWKVEHFYFVRYPHDDQTLDDITLTQHVPRAWLDRYNEKNYLRVDTALKFAAQTFFPFKYAEVPDPAGEASELVRDLASYKLSNALVIPVNDVPGNKGVVWLQGSELDPHPIAILQAVALYTFQRLTAKFYESPPRLLSIREAEALAWAAAGKSAWEIGEILQITQRTVEEHLASAIRKLGATNRAHAVAIALRDHIITF